VKALVQILGSVLVACLGVAAYVVYVNTRADTLAAAIERTVTEQLEAFRSGNYDRAYAIAAAGLQRSIDRQRFEAMIRRDYPGIAENASLALGDLVHDDDSASLNVTVVTASGRSFQYQYRLALEKDAWRVTGVTPVFTRQTTRKKVMK
jgi:CHASE2 domain-containing sensor protein